ncbi:MAG: helix-turn-helix domain containing protein [Candidatus Omnitrophica bacterium]|nr:helix-turn-helix domain containing protein [Candidatus Omnitrophota bacterium]
MRQTINKDRLELIVKLFKEDKKVKEVANILGFSTQRLYQIINKYNLPKKNKKAKLKNCIVCGKSFPVYFSNESLRKYCSRNCQKKDTRTVLLCSYCGKEFNRKKSLLKYAKKYFCSRECYYCFLRKKV